MDSVNQALEDELKELIVTALVLEDAKPTEIDVEAPLFGAGLELDSIDALELAVAIDKKYGVKLKTSNEENEKIFASVRSLAGYIAQARTSESNQ